MKTRNRKNTPARGGFVPSIGEPFSLLASKYITPLALYSGYKLIANMNKKPTRRRNSHYRRGKKHTYSKRGHTRKKKQT